MRAAALENANRTGDALALLKEIDGRWPEWPATWAAQGMSFVLHRSYEEARQGLEAAFVLGSRSPEASFFPATAYDAPGQEADLQRERDRLRRLTVFPRAQLGTSAGSSRAVC
jgi:hypothetical protein